MNSLFQYANTHFSLIIAVAFGILAPLTLIFLAKLYRKRKSPSFINVTLSYLEIPLSLIIFLLVILKPLTSLFNSEILTRGMQITIIAAFAWLFLNFVLIGESWIRIKYDMGKTDNIRERRIYTQVHFIKRLLIILILVISLASILLTFKTFRNIGTGILATAGVFGAVVVFTTQRSLVNILAGFQIAFTQPIRIDDVLIVENEWGKVEEITLTYVVIRIWDLRRLILPINYFLEKPFQNWSRISTDLLGTVMLYTDYEINLIPVRSELARVLKESPLWDGVVCRLQVTDATAKTIELRILISARNSSDLWDLRCEVREKLIDFIKTNFPNSLPKNRLEILKSNASDNQFSFADKQE